MVVEFATLLLGIAVTSGGQRLQPFHSFARWFCALRSRTKISQPDTIVKAMPGVSAALLLSPTRSHTYNFEELMN